MFKISGRFLAMFVLKTCSKRFYKKSFILILVAFLFISIGNLVLLFTNFDSYFGGKTGLQSVFPDRPGTESPEARVLVSRPHNESPSSHLLLQRTSSALVSTLSSNEVLGIAGIHFSKSPQASTASSREVAQKPGTYPAECDTWCRRGDHASPPYFLTAVLLVRIYREDLAALSSRELFQWLCYLRYAGFEHVYIYDAYVAKNESQYHVIAPLVQSGYATYVDWSEHNPYTMQGTQVSAYRHCVAKFGAKTEWKMAFDIDEYPFSPVDRRENFMRRFLLNYSREHPRQSQISLQNFLFLGKPLDDRRNPLLLDRIRRRTRTPANPLGKSVFKTADVDAAQVHRHDLRRGETGDCEPRVMRLNHYWGARLQDWGEDTPKILDMTEPDYSTKPIVEKMNLCAKCFGGDNVYVKRWN